MAGLNTQGPSRTLVLGSYFYVLIPAVLQLGFWLRWYFAVVVVLGGGLLVAHLWGHVEPGERPLDWKIPSLAGVIVAFLAGAGGVLSYTGDWRKHFAILRDMTNESWPVIYQLPEGDGVLSYSAGWYMPASVIGKAFGWSAGNVAISLWLALGVALVASWAVFLVGHHDAILVILLFSGLDIVGRFLLPAISDWDKPGTNSFDTWSSEWQVPSVLRNLFEAPQHTLPTLVVACLILGGQFRRQPAMVQLAIVAAVAISSPFAAIAVVPFALYTFVRTERPHLAVEMGALALMLGVGCFYLVRLGGPPVGIPNEVSIGFTFADPINDVGLKNLLIAFAVVVLLEVLVYAIPLSLALGKEARRLIWLGVAFLGLCMLFRIGFNNDLAMRGPGMGIFVLALFAAKVFVERSSPWRPLVAVVLLIGAFAPVYEVRRNLTGAEYGGYSFTSAEETIGLVEMGPVWYPDRDSLLSQYLSDSDGPAKWVLRIPG